MQVLDGGDDEALDLDLGGAFGKALGVERLGVCPRGGGGCGWRRGDALWCGDADPVVWPAWCDEDLDDEKGRKARLVFYLFSYLALIPAHFRNYLAVRSTYDFPFARGSIKKAKN